MRRCDHVACRRACGIFTTALATALVACVLPGFSRAAADEGQRVHRCVGANGEIVFSGLPCSEPRSGYAAPPMSTGIPAAPITSCPVDRDELGRRLEVAVARQDANAIAALLDWRGVGGRGAASRMAELARLVKLPLLGIDQEADAVAVRTGSGGSYAELRFGIEERAACLWLAW